MEARTQRKTGRQKGKQDGRQEKTRRIDKDSTTPQTSPNIHYKSSFHFFCSVCPSERDIMMDINVCRASIMQRQGRLTGHGVHCARHVCTLKECVNIPTHSLLTHSLLTHSLLTSVPSYYTSSPAEAKR